MIVVTAEHGREAGSRWEGETRLRAVLAEDTDAISGRYRCVEIATVSSR